MGCRWGHRRRVGRSSGRWQRGAGRVGGRGVRSSAAAVAGREWSLVVVEGYARGEVPAAVAGRGWSDRGAVVVVVEVELRSWRRCSLQLT